jgi:hypothetical protein
LKPTIGNRANAISQRRNATAKVTGTCHTSIAIAAAAHNDNGKNTREGRHARQKSPNFPPTKTRKIHKNCHNLREKIPQKSLSNEDRFYPHLEIR